MAINKRLLGLIDRTEGGGSYSTLYGNRQRRKGSPFEGVDVSNMSIGQVIDFTRPDGAYGQSVKGEIGRVATPTGRFQIVGTTLRNAVNELGLDPNTPYNAETQDLIANHLAQKRLNSADSMAGKRAAMRAEWEGLQHVSDADLDAAILNQGDYTPPSGQPYQPTQVASSQPTKTPIPEGADPRNYDANGKELTGLKGFGRDIRNGIDDAIGVKLDDDGNRSLWGFTLDGKDSDLTNLAGFGSALAGMGSEKSAPPPPPQGGRISGGSSATVQLQFAESLVNTKEEDDPRKRRGGLVGFGGFTRRA
ncbi:hypothetical protein CFBP6625_06195 [Agrobacterium tumefaciens]|nr:hypothetical protein CFBP6625_06195 [Agrobacterium tumefaciens]